MRADTQELENIVRRFRRELEIIGIRPERILLFGSHARGQAREGSDIDLIVVSPDWARFNRRERLEMLGLAAVRIMESIQAHGFTPLEITSHQTGPFWEEIIQREAVAV
ncbi:MAG: nucleotidyltransferase domain-containing protein [Anaerolineales bacterium]